MTEQDSTRTLHLGKYFMWLFLGIGGIFVGAYVGEQFDSFALALLVGFALAGVAIWRMTLHSMKFDKDSDNHV